MPEDVQEFMIGIVKRQIEFREKNNVSRKDFIQFLIQLRNTGQISEDGEIWDVETSADELKSISIEQCAGQVFLFYVAGFDTSATILSYTLYELAKNQEILRRVQMDIDETLAKHNGKITFDSLMDMKYVDLCLMGMKSSVINERQD